MKLTPAQIRKALDAAGLTPRMPLRERIIGAVRDEAGLSTDEIAERAADSIFSEWVRRSASDKGGTVECVTCGKLMHWTGNGAQAGHFVKRQHMALRYDVRNVHVQCIRCNKWRGGEEGEYGHYIINLYGVEAHQELMRLKRTIKKFTRAELESVINDYKNKLQAFEPRSA